MVDNVQQVEQLENFAGQDSSVPPWSVFIKVDVGTRRAGLETTSLSFGNLVKKVEVSPAVSLYGFYCHAGHSYGCRTTEEAEKVLGDELDGVVKAAGLLDDHSKANKDRELVVSVGSTPTAHVANSLRQRLPKGVELELHAGSSIPIICRDNVRNKRQETTPPTTSNKSTPSSSPKASKQFVFSLKCAASTPSATRPSSTRAPLPYRRRQVTHRATVV